MYVGLSFIRTFLLAACREQFLYVAGCLGQLNKEHVQLNSGHLAAPAPYYSCKHASAAHACHS